MCAVFTYMRVRVQKALQKGLLNLTFSNKYALHTKLNNISKLS